MLLRHHTTTTIIIIIVFFILAPLVINSSELFIGINLSKNKAIASVVSLSPNVTTTTFKFIYNKNAQPWFNVPRYLNSFNSKNKRNIYDFMKIDYFDAEIQARIQRFFKRIR